MSVHPDGRKSIIRSHMYQSIHTTTAFKLICIQRQVVKLQLLPELL